ncbi:MAG: YfhO family protein, partial [Bacteroidota bacterium]
VAMIGALAYGFNTFNIISIEAGHIWKVRAMAYMPLVLAGVKLIYDRNNKLLWGFVLTSIALALEIRSNHLQITYYLALLLIAFGINELIQAIKQKAIPDLIKRTSIVFAAVILALGANCGRLWTVYEYGNYSTRGKSDLAQTASAEADSGLGKDYVFNWSHGVVESMTLLVPNFYGGASQQAVSETSALGEALRKNGQPRQQIRQLTRAANTYWGDQPGVAGPVLYAGVIILFLFVLGMMLLRKKYWVWIVSAAAFSIMLAWGKNFEMFNYFMYDYFPGYNKFRSVTMASSIALVLIPLLAFLALEKIFNSNLDKKLQKRLLIAFGVTGGLALLCFVLAGLGTYRGAVDARLAESFPEWYISALRDVRKSLLRIDAIRSVFFITCAGAVIYFHLKNKLSAFPALVLIGILSFLDPFLVDKRYVNKENFAKNPRNNFFDPNGADEFILADKDPNFRVINLLNPWNEARTSYHHKSIGGYHGAKPKRYAELMDYCINNELNSVISNLQSGKIDFSSARSLNMLNTKYFMFGDTKERVVQNTQSYGHAWIPTTIQKVNSADEEISATCSAVDRTNAIVDVSRFSVSDGLMQQGSIKLNEYRPNYLNYSANLSGKSLIVFAEAYYAAGWKAFVDGEEIDILRANYILRALEVEQGDHTIEFRFEPDAYFVGNKAMMASSGIIILLLLAMIILSFKENKSIADDAGKVE